MRTLVEPVDTWTADFDEPYQRVGPLVELVETWTADFDKLNQRVCTSIAPVGDN